MTRRNAAFPLAMGALATVLSWAACANGELIVPPDNAPHIDLAITHTVSDANPDEGASIVFTITVENLGPIVATDVAAIDSLPTGVRYVSHTESVGTFNTQTGYWTIGQLAVGAQAVLALTVTTNVGTGNTTLTNRAGVGTGTMRDTVPSNNIASASVNVAGPVGQPPGIVFSSSWSTATGNSANAVTDGGTWPELRCGSTFPNVLTVVQGSSVGFTETPNVLRVQQRGPTDCGMLQRDNIFPQSTTHWGRFYFRNDEVGSSQNHPTAYHQWDGQTQAVAWLRDATVANNRNRVGIQVGQHGYPFQKWYSPPLDNGVWYRYEWMFEYVTPLTFRILPRIYNAAGTLLYDVDDFVQTDYARDSDLTLAEFYAQNSGTRVFTLGIDAGETNAALARNFGMGNEGNASAPATMGYWYYAKVGFSTAGWLGR